MKTAILIILTFSLSYCLGQTPIPQRDRIYYDTLKLLLPKSTKEDVAAPEDYRHCIDLTKVNYQIIIAGKKYVKSDLQELTSFVKANRSRINSQKLSLISDSTTDYEKIVNALDLVTEAKINNYKLVSVNGTPPKLPEVSPVIVQSTIPFTKDIDLSDSTVLVISISELSFETTLFGKKSIHSEIAKLDSFINGNRGSINPNKIVVTAAEDLPYKVVDPVLSVLAKYEYHNYHIIPKN